MEEEEVVVVVDYDRLYSVGRFAGRMLGYSDAYLDAADLFNGWRAYRDKKASNQLQIDYNTMMANANQRAYNDWIKNVKRSMRYPELSYLGAVASYSSGTGRAYLSNDIAGSELVGSLPYRGAGLYGIPGRALRRL